MTDVVSPLEKSQNICVYCGSSSGNGPEYAAEAVALGRELASQNLVLVSATDCRKLAQALTNGS